MIGPEPDGYGEPALVDSVGVLHEPTMTSVTLVVWLRLPLTPVTVIVYVPNGVVALVVTDIVALVLLGLGLNVAAAPLGSPPALNVTAPAKPALGVTVTV
jgi:hypothetical protein